VPGAVCGDGSPTGFAVRAVPGSTKLLIFFQGGGACFDAASCSIDSNFGPYMGTDFCGSAPSGGVFSRTDQANPFLGYNIAFFPYCTGDLHTGNRTVTMGGKTGYFKGYHNAGLFLGQVELAFPPATMTDVVVMGASAGGMGATFNYDRIRSGYYPTAHTLVSDSGPYFEPKNGVGVTNGGPYVDQTIDADMANIWGTGCNLPAGCTQCRMGLYNLYAYYMATYTPFRGSLIESVCDKTICAHVYDQNGDVSCSLMPGALADFKANLAQEGTFDVFFVDGPDVPPDAGPDFGTQHVWSESPLFYEATTAGTLLTTFLSNQVTGSSAWASAVPPGWPAHVCTPPPSPASPATPPSTPPPPCN
jgi:hypothetical protein